LGALGLAFGLVGLARTRARLALRLLNSAAGLGDPSGLRFRGCRALQRPRHRSHPGERLEARRLELFGQTSGAKLKPPHLVERGCVESLRDPLDDRVADRATLVGEDVATEARQRPHRPALLREPILQVGTALATERALLRLAQLLRRPQE